MFSSAIPQNHLSSARVCDVYEDILICLLDPIFEALIGRNMRSNLLVLYRWQLPPFCCFILYRLFYSVLFCVLYRCIASMTPLCALFGSLLISIPMQLFGRKKALIGLSIPFVAGFLLMGLAYYSRHKAQLYVGRILTGLMNGAATPAAQIYVRYTIQAKPSFDSLVNGDPMYCRSVNVHLPECEVCWGR